VTETAITFDEALLAAGVTVLSGQCRATVRARRHSTLLPLTPD